MNLLDQVKTLGDMTSCDFSCLSSYFLTLAEDQLLFAIGGLVIWGSSQKTENKAR